MELVPLIPMIVALTAMIVFFVCVVATSGKKDAESFKRRFPSMSDAEFVARCTPGTNPDIALRVR